MPWNMAKPMYSMHTLHGTLIRLGFVLKGDMNYTIWVLKYVNGGQGGDINAPWKLWPSSLGLGLLHWFGHL